MEYQVRFVSDTDLPAGPQWVFATQNGRTVLFVKESAIDTGTGECEALSRAWEVWESSEGHHEPPRPRRRLRTEVGYIRTAVAVLMAGYGITAMKVGSAVL